MKDFRHIVYGRHADTAHMRHLAPFSLRDGRKEKTSYVESQVEDETPRVLGRELFALDLVQGPPSSGSGSSDRCVGAVLLHSLGRDRPHVLLDCTLPSTW